MKMMRVEVWLDNCVPIVDTPIAPPVVYDKVTLIVQKGAFVCIEYLEGTEKFIDKFPIEHVNRIRSKEFSE